MAAFESIYRRLFLAVLGAAACSLPAAAHHALSAHYLADRDISITGTVDEFRYTNPHAVVFLLVEGEQKEAEVWTVEWAGSSALRRRGILPNSLSRGDRVTLHGHPARDGSHAMALQRVQFADGRPEIGPPDRSSGEEE